MSTYIAIIKFYCRLIAKGQQTIADIPPQYKKEVAKMIKELEASSEGGV